MDLILWRHAEAESGMPDAQRKLTEKGHKQAKQMAAWLNRQLPQDARILASPAVRAQQTASALQRAFETSDAINTSAGPEAVLGAIGWPDTEGVVLVVGHQPTLGQLAARLVSGQAQYWSVKKGAIWWISNREREGEAQNILRCVLAPDLL